MREELRGVLQAYYIGIGGNVAWGNILGDIENQIDLMNQFDTKVPVARELTINGVTHDLSSNRSWTIGTPDLSSYVPYTGATQDVNLGEFELKAGQIEYDQTPTGAAGVAITRWNDSIGTLETTLKGGNVVLKHGRDLFERVVNKTGIQLTKAAYQAVRVSTAQGQRLGVSLAQANNDNNSADTIGLVVETIDNNQEGMIYVVGEIDGINTTGSLQSETWADGDVLYLSPTTAGRITNVKPTAPQHLVVIGYVVYAHANQGKIYVKVNNGFELGELHDVDTTGATNGQVLKFNGTIWTAQTDSGTPSGVAGAVQFSNGSAFASDATNFFWDDANNRLGIATASPTDTLHNTGTTRLDGLLKFSGTTSAFPALKRNSTELQVRLADDSAFAPLISGRFEANQTTISVSNIATAITNGSFIGANLGGQQFGLLIGVDQSGFSYIQGRYLSAADHIRIQEFGSGISVGSATGDGYIAIGRTSQLASSRLGISVAPTASANYGLVSLGSGAFDGATSGFFTGVAAGTVIAVNLASGGTSDLLNMQVAGVNRFKVSSAGLVGIGTASPTDTLHNTGTTRLDGLLKFSGTTSAFPALKRNNTELQVRLADDSGFAPIQALGGTFNDNTYIKALGVNQTLTGNFSGVTFAVNTGSMAFAMTGATFGFYNTSASDLADGQIRTSGLAISNILFGTPHASAILDVASTTKGFAMPRMTGAQVEAISTPIQSLLAYATNAGAGAVTSAGAWIYNGTTWVKLATGSTSISIGDIVTSAGANRIFYYNGGLAQSSGFEYNSGTTTFLAPNIETSTGIVKSTSTSLTFQNGSTSRLIVSSNGVYYAPSSNTNTSYGYTAMMLNTGTENTAFGYQSLMSGSLSGAYNTGFGSSTLRANTTGTSNSAFGRYALYSNTTGSNNMGVGHTALYLNTTGAGNVAIGLDALRKSTTTNYNVAIGTSAMFGGTSPSGAGNIAIGYSALEMYTSADYNIAVGYRGGAGITTGDYNTIVGYKGAFDLTTGSYNTFIGQRDSSGITTGSYNTIIGHVTGLSSSLANTIIIADGNGGKGIEWSGTRLTAYANVLNITTAKTPASASDTGKTGDIAWDTNYLYVCTATNTWKRAALATW